MIPITLGEALDKSNNHGRYQVLLFLISGLFTAQEVFHICLDVFTAKPLPWRWQDEDSAISRSTYPPCDTSREWVYSKNATISIRSEFGIYCNPLMLRLITCAFFVGRLCGFIVFWNVSVQFGRRWPIIISIWCNSIVTWLISCSVSYEVYVILRALDGFTIEGYVIGSYVLLLECINEDSRQVFASQYRSLQGVGFILLAGTAYFSSSWRVMVLIAGILITVHGSVASVFIPESPKWLLAKGRSGDIVTFIHKVSTWNRRRIKDQFYIIDTKKKRPSESVFSEKEVLLTAVCLVCVWGLLHVAEYTLYLNILFLPGNAYLNLLLLGICDIPARAVAIYMMERWGRRPSILIWNLVAGSFLFICCFDNNIVRSLFYLLSKLVLAGNILLVKIYTHELSPTSTNSTIYKWCMFSTRVVGCGVPFLLYLNPLQMWYIYAVAGGCVIVSTVFIAVLPETKAGDQGRRPKKPMNVNEYIGLFYGSRFRPAAETNRYPTANGNLIPAADYKPRNLVGERRAEAEEGSGTNSRRTWSEELSTRSSRTKQDYDIVALSNVTDVGNLSVYDPDILKFQKQSSLKGLKSLPVQPLANSTPRMAAPQRPSSLNLSSKPRNKILSRNPSYESSLNECHTVMSDTPDTSMLESEQEIIKRNSLVSFTPKSSVKKNFFSLSRV